MNNNLDHKAIAEDIVSKIVTLATQSTMLRDYINTGLDDATQKTVKFYARDVVRAECSVEGVDGNSLSKALGVPPCSSLEEWENSMVSKSTETAYDELRNKIQAPIILESTIQEANQKPRYQVLLG